MGRGLLGRVERLERGPAVRVSLWDVWLGGADPALLDPDTRAVLLSLSDPPPPGPDPVEERLAPVLALPVVREVRYAPP